MLGHVKGYFCNILWLVDVLVVGGTITRVSSLVN